jgi:peptidoglycan/LPS O-acetylase OafA/YrhL
LFLDGRWITFACGITVYYDRVYATPRQRWVCRAVLVWLLLSWLTNPRRQSAELLIATAFALLLIGLQRWDAAWARAGVPRLFWWCGTRCYSLYLVHWPITLALSRALFEAGVRTIWGTLLVTLPLCMAVSLLAAWAFHAAVERRFLNRPRTVSPAPLRSLPVELLQA